MIRPGRWVKKSKFYEARDSSDAYGKYLKQNGHVAHTFMWCEKDKRHAPDRLVGQTAHLFREIRAEQESRGRSRFGDIGEFFHLGGELFEELKRVERNKVVARRDFSKQERLGVHLE